MTWLETIPMLRPFVFLLSGVLIGYYSGVRPGILLALTVVFLFTGAFLMYRRFRHTRWMTISGLCFMFSLTFAGAYSYSSQKEYMPLEDGFYTYKAVASKIISQRAGYTRCYLDIIAVKNTGISKPYRIISNIYDDNILPGDTVLGSSYIRKIARALNAGQFDVQKYYGYKWVYQTTSLRKSNFLKQSYQGAFNFQRWCFIAGRWCGGVYSRLIPERSAYTMQALLLGIKDEISDDMMEVYMNTGVMHVLAVSGMHVGILYVGIMAILKPVYRRWKYITIFPIILVWIFSFITGGGPAILRSAIMITFIDIGKKLDEDSDSVNLLFVSGWFLLIFQPYLVWDIGFQLSFAAMLGLFYLMKPIQDVLYVKTQWIKDYIWSPAAMSVSAQLVTTPLTFFYFGNFPVLFLLTNLVILLPITIALYGGVGLLLTSVILPEFINVWIGKALDFVIYYGFDAFLKWIVALPGAYTNQIYLSHWQVIVLALSIFFLGYWIYHVKNGRWLVYSVLLCLITVGGSLFRQWNLRKDIRVTILQVPDQHVVAVNNYLWNGGSNASQVIHQNGFFINGYLRDKGWKQWTFVPLDFIRQDSTTLIVGDQSIFVLNQNMRDFSSSQPIEVNYLVLGNDLYLNTEMLLEKFRFQHLVLDGGLDYSKYQLFKRLLNNAEIPFIDTRENGAIEIVL